MMWVQPAFNTVAVVGIMFLLLVAQMAELDRSTRADPEHLRWLRRISFYAAAGVLVVLVMTNLWDWWQPNIYALLPIASAVFILAVNWAVLARRQQAHTPPPIPGHMVARGLSSDATRNRGRRAP